MRISDILNGTASVLHDHGALGSAVNVPVRKPNTQRTDIDGQISYRSQDMVNVAAAASG